MWFFVALFAFLNVAILACLVAGDLYRKGLGTEPEDRVMNCWICLGLIGALALTIHDLIAHAI